MAREHSYNSGRISRAGSGRPQNPAPQPAPGPQKGKPTRKKRKRWATVLLVCAIVIGVVATGLGAAYLYLDGVFDPGNLGTINIDNYTPKEYQADSINILIAGIDYEEGRYSGDGLGLTDLIMVANFLPKEGKLNLLQIPRDSFVGTDVSVDGKINSLLRTGPDKTNPINNLATVISNQYKIPIDRYITLDMDGLKAIINTFNGIRVYVPKEMSYGGSYLPQGWQWLNGDQVEFFVRNRKGAGFERADLDRLDNQRHFYSALFRRFLNLTPGDMMKLLPVFEYYCNTDIGMGDLFDLGFSALGLQSENIMMCKVPGATSASEWSAGLGYPALQTPENTYYVVDVYGRGTEEEPGVAALLNTYFRTYGEQVPAENLGIPPVQIPGSVSLYSPTVQVMGSVFEGEGGADIDVEPTGE
ncbi:LCP family protein [Ruminococcaceae bacterium OttesenSCG-928-A16]|nr:LCP family protein [Ruminococcaceae bacterium OttesenSCG-928-A16]